MGILWNYRGRGQLAFASGFAACFQDFSYKPESYEKRCKS